MPEDYFAVTDRRHRLFQNPTLVLDIPHYHLLILAWSALAILYNMLKPA
jgi:hypothetical protein